MSTKILPSPIQQLSDRNGNSAQHTPPAVVTASLPRLRRARSLPQLPDYLAPELDIIFVGINPGEQSALAGHYYANPRNPFWRLLHRAGLTPRELRPEEDHLMPSFGYGLTDVVKRPTPGVADLRPAEFKRGRRVLERKLHALQPIIVCFNGKMGFMNFFGAQRFKRFGPQAVTIGVSRVFVLPSTSPANAGVPISLKLRYFRALRTWREDLAHERWLQRFG